MGLLDLIKKTINSLASNESANVPQYNPWENNTMFRNDNYAIAAFIAMSVKGAKVGKCNDDYPRYFNYEYKVNNPVEYHNNVISEGYLKKAESYIALNHLKVEQLKSIMNENGLSNKGKKDELIKCIIGSIDVDSLELDTYYVPTEKGIAHLERYDYVLKLKDYNIKWEEYDRIAEKECCQKPPNDIIWGIMQTRYFEYMKEGLYSYMRNERLCMANFMKQEKRFKDALKLYIDVLNYDVSGCGNNGRVVNVESIVVAPKVVKEIYELRNYFDDAILDKLDSLPHHHIKTKSDFRMLIIDIMEDKFFDIKKYIK